MYTSDELTSLTNLAGGAAIELFDLELAEAVKNIDDINRQVKTERTITLVVKLKPTENQGMIAVDIEVKPKLAARNVVNTLLIYGKDSAGHIETRELHKQRQLWDDPNNKVLPIKKREE